jgi:hypothetical protein
MLRIGWAWADMTPERPVLLAGQHYARVSTHVNDPLTVTALALEEEGGEQTILISADLVHISAETQAAVRRQVAKHLPDLDVRKLVVSVTHTHTSLVLEEGLYAPP